MTARCLELGLNVNIMHPRAGRLPGPSGVERSERTDFRGFGSVFRIAPPLTASIAELDRGVEILDRALTDCTRA